jgi:hypothetical protein
VVAGVVLVLLARVVLILNQMAVWELQVVLLAPLFIMAGAVEVLIIELTVQVILARLLVTVVTEVAVLVAAAKEMVKQAVLPELAVMEHLILEAVVAAVHIFHQFRPGDQVEMVDRE